MDPISPGIASNAIWAIINTAARIVFHRKIRITYPRPKELMGRPEPLPSGFSYPVEGTLKSLQNGHEIWVLAQDESTGQIWPQGLSPVVYDRVTGEWSGRIFGGDMTRVRIFAVVTPPTSQDLFRYFLKVGGLRSNVFEPLVRLPDECVNFDSVQAQLPKT